MAMIATARKSTKFRQDILPLMKGHRESLPSRGEVPQNAIIHHENFAKCNIINAHSVGLTTRRRCPMVANHLEPWLISLNFRNLARFLLE